MRTQAAGEDEQLRPERLVAFSRWPVHRSVSVYTIGKGISRGVERRKFQLNSTFQRGVMSMEGNLVETPYYSPWFSDRK